MKKTSVAFVLRIAVYLFLLLLPYYLFQGKLFIGGDDTRLFYSYPFEYLKNLSYFSWYNGSTIGVDAAHQFVLPFFFLWSVLSKIITNRVVLSYFGFSLPLILGFVYFQKFVSELFRVDKKYDVEVLVGSLFYLLSPILIINQLFIFLTAIWLLGVVPAIGYYYIKYVRTSEFRYIFYSIIFSVIFSISVFAMPWICAELLSLGIGGFGILFLTKRNELWTFIKRSFVYVLWLLFAHAFWIIGFIAPYLIVESNSFAATYASKGFADSFSPIVLSTAKSFIIYPLLNLFHRQIAFDFSWALKNDFIRLYDKTFFLNFVFVLLFFFGLFQFKKRFDAENRKNYLLILISFLSALYFFTVNIGPLKELFLAFGKIPGFVMFRNFYDKFAPAYVFLYALLFTVGLVLFREKYPKGSKKFIFVVLLVILINFSPVKSIVNSPLWTTDTVYRTITMPKEYLEFMEEMKKTVPSTNAVLSIPYGISVYSVVKDETSDNVYLGISPVKIFSGLNDFSGNMSFNFTDEGNQFDTFLIDKSYDKLTTLLFNHNINYVLVTNNVPKQVLRSWAFDPKTLSAQDDEFLSAVTDKKILTSSDGNYELYTTKKQNSMLSSEGLTYTKRNNVDYSFTIDNLHGVQSFRFNDSFNSNWKIYPVKYASTASCQTPVVAGTGVHECKEAFRFFGWEELSYLWKKPVFNGSHRQPVELGNEWIIDSQVIRQTLGKEYYVENSDGTITVRFELYYKPQMYFYYGLIISVVTLTGSCIVFFVSKQKKKYAKT